MKAASPFLGMEEICQELELKFWVSLGAPSLEGSTPSLSIKAAIGCFAVIGT